MSTSFGQACRGHSSAHQSCNNQYTSSMASMVALKFFLEREDIKTNACGILSSHVLGSAGSATEWVVHSKYA
ncbi:hypothetical protein MJO28_011198 [Puccinia striiformis f. sp. tritici]|uniref:Uncharacterized protein n=1 Tax=Puccinia striiformis f. sp. tritici TaxID=168172 RepID=A0ACC0E1V5_9BASI|nr:hypothetical protein MJO28_011198 [Puccinia striiformis f. sp. tritici]